MVSALCILMMFLTGVFPLLGMTIPIYSGIILLAVYYETDGHWSALSYFAVALLSMFITPDKEAAILFIMFFGYYPVLKCSLEKSALNTVLKWLIKFLIFNVSIITAYRIITDVLGIYDLIDEFGFLGSHLKTKLIFFANAVFVFYDFTIGMLEQAYLKWFRPIYLRKK